MMNAMQTETENCYALCGAPELVSEHRENIACNEMQRGRKTGTEQRDSQRCLYPLFYRYAAREWLDLDWNPASALGLSDNRARFFPASV
jgi:hypothetical protein